MFSTVSANLMIRMVISSVVMLSIGLAVIFYIKQGLIVEGTKTLLERKDAAIGHSYDEKMGMGLSALYAALATTPELQPLFENKDHAAIRQLLASMPPRFKAETEFKNIRLNAFDAEGNILMRSGTKEPDSERGKSALHRAGFKEMLSGGKPHYETLDLSRAGLNLVSVVPVKNDQGRVLGLLEFQSGFGSIVINLVERSQIYMIQVLDDQALTLFTAAKDNGRLGNYFIAHTSQYDRSKAWFSDINVNTVVQNRFDIQDNKALLFTPVLTGEGKQVAYRIVGLEMNHPEVLEMSRSVNAIIINMLLLLVLIIAGMMLVLWWFSKRLITQPLSKLSSGLEQIAQTGKLELNVHYRANDEVGRMANRLEQVFTQVAEGVHHANKVVTAIGQGDFSKRLDGQYIGDLAILQSGVNASAESVAFMMQELSKVMKGLSEGRFDVQMDIRVAENFRSQVDHAMQSVSAVIQDISQVMQRLVQGKLDMRVRCECQGDL